MSHFIVTMNMDTFTNLRWDGVLLNYDVVLFDFDGTLTESGLGITRSVAYAFEQMDLPVPGQDILDRFVGPPLVASFEKYGNMDESDAIRATELYRVRYRATGWKENRVYPGITPLLKALKAAGCYLAIASGKPEVFVRQIAEYFGIDRYFDRIVGNSLDDIHADKCALISRALPENRNCRAAMVGDRLFDMEAAKKCGLDAIGALYGYGSREELQQAGADQIAASVEELRRILLPGQAVEQGLLITFEGTDGCGKSTQMNLLAQYLQQRGYETIVSREPGGCEISERIREMVLDVRLLGMSPQCEALLYAAARAEHVRQVILPALKSGKIVLCDRFLDSSFAYQARGRELGDEFIRQINVPASVVVPNRTLLFVGDRAIAAQRVRASGELDRIEVEKEDFFHRVDQAYAEIYANEPNRVHLFNSNQAIEEIFAQVCADVNELLN